MRTPSAALSSITLASLRVVIAAILPVEADPLALFITSSPPQPFLADCLRSSYYGTFGGSPDAQDHIYFPPPGCLDATHTLDGVKSGSIVPLPLGWGADDGRVVWVGQAGVEERLSATGGAEEMMRSWELISERSWSLLAAQEAQKVIISSTASRHVEPVRLLHATTSSLLLHVPDSFMPILDTLLPAHLVPVALPRSTLPTISGWDPVPSDLAMHLANLTAHLDFSPQLDRIVSVGIDLDDIRRNVRWLTGEAPSGFHSRHSFTEGAVKAAHWIKSKVETTGAECSFNHFMTGFAPNVLCRYPSLHNSTEHVILSAHYDSRGSWGMTRAPGGDDDGSGTGHLLAIAEAIGSQGVKFEKSVTLAFFAGEEQGLIGSNAYAEYLHAENATVIFQLQADMLAYHDSGEPLQMGLPETIGLPEASYLVGNLSQLYSPELLVGRTAACCSDHQSFVAYGFPATQVFERNGWIIDPMYHNSGDLTQRDNYDFSQVVSIAKVTMAAILTVAGYKVES